jgi:hypothetical protein
MLKAAFALIPLMAGYVFISTWLATRYLIKREDSQKLYIRAAFWGLWLFLLAFALTYQMKDSFLIGLGFFRSLMDSVPFEAKNEKIDTAFWIFTLTITLLIGTFGGYILNWFYAIFVTPKKKLINIILNRLIGAKKPALLEIYDHARRDSIKKAITVMNADLELILLRAMEENMPVCVTLGHGKVYVGLITGSIDPGDKRDMLRILPLVSGYRKSDDYKITFTTSYISLYDLCSEGKELDHLDPSKFEIVFPHCEIKSVNLFDINAYNASQSNSNELSNFPPD